MSIRFSKTTFQQGVQREKALWLRVHEPDSADPLSESLQWTFDQGTTWTAAATVPLTGRTSNHKVSEDSLWRAVARDISES